MAYAISTDIGGTFVDAVILDPQGRLAIGKASSTPEEPATGLMAAIEVAAGNMGLDLERVLGACGLFVNGTTVTTNAMIQGRWARTGLLITRGFEDTLVIGRVKARTAGLDEFEVTNYQEADRPMGVVPITLTRGLEERIDSRGRVIRPLDPQDVEATVDDLVAQGIEALAICLLWSFRNPIHEQAVRDLVRRRHPRLYVTASSDLIPVIREYERANTAAINAALGPTIARYVRGIEETMRWTRCPAELLIMQSVGGLSPAAQVRDVPVATLYSGPVGGIIAAQKLGELLGLPNVITTDMGGTSFDVGMIVEGVAESHATTTVERQILMVPAVDCVSIGAGGGSVAWLDELLSLHVGPQSMGATPGPACYGRGGERPTVTDADVILGYINPEYFLGGAMRLDPVRAEKALRAHVADPLGLTVEEAALAVYDIVNAHMADLIRKVSIERGHDPRAFTLLAFGGCGPTHCTGYGPEIGARQIIVPGAATVFSALGIVESDIKHFYSRSSMVLLPRQGEVDERLLEEVNATFAVLLEQARAQLARDGVAPERMVLRRSIDMRYENQTNELIVPVSWTGAMDAGGLRRLQEEFVKRYEMLYGSGSRSHLAAIELITLRVEALASTPFAHQVVRHPRGAADAGEAFVGTRRAYWREARGFRETRVFRGERLRCGHRVEGPAVIEYYGTTIPLHAGQVLEVDELLNAVITVPAASHGEA